MKLGRTLGRSIIRDAMALSVQDANDPTPTPIYRSRTLNHPRLLTNMASLQAHDVITAPVTAPANARTDAQLPHKDVYPQDKKEDYINFEDEKLYEEEDGEMLDNLFPFPPLKGVPDEEQQLSIRALVIGIMLGAVVSASNIYLGLKTGWTFGASLFGGILGFAIIKPLSRIAPRYLGGGYFGPKVYVVALCGSEAS
jgi:hypothetical protein